EHSQHFVKVASSAHWVTEHQLDLLVGTDYEHGAYSCVRGCGTPFATIASIGRQHVVKLGNLKLGIADHRVVHFVSLGLFDIRCPFVVGAHRVHAQSDNLAVPLCEFRLQPGHVSQLGGADGCKVLGVGEQDCPAIANPLMKTDGALRCFRCEVWCFVVDAYRHSLLRE